MFEKNIFNFHESIVFEKMRKKAIKYAKIRVKWPTLSRLYRGKIQSYKTEIFLLKSILSFLSIHGMF